MSAVQYRTRAARERARITRRYETAKRAGRSEEELRAMATSALDMLTCWERALVALLVHYERLGRTFYGCYIADLGEELARGVGSVNTFRRVVMEVFDIEPDSPGLSRLVTTARAGKVAEILGGDGFGARDVGATLAGAEAGAAS